MLSILAASEAGVVVLDTSDGIPVLEVVCGRCTFQMSMIAYAPIASVADATAMAATLIDRHSATCHPERVS